MVQKKEFNIVVKKDGKFYAGYCIEMPQAGGQGNTKAEAIEDTKKAIKMCKSYLQAKSKTSKAITVTI